MDTIKGELGMPWFVGSMISVESCYYDDQFSPNEGFCSRSENHPGHPLWGSPDGIGLMQPDRTQDGQYFINATYWNYAVNMETANDVLNAKKSGAYTFWNNQVSQSNSTPVPTGLNTTCDGSYFSYPVTGSWSFEDAEWIQAYNGTWPNGYFIAWNEPSYPGQWHINYPYVYNNHTYDYVHQVCNATSY